ncbi:hypothetical protein, partial [Burkholderia gladioli]|uniref:hypothetical protein n=1 Tax=Burkholderia gladioli TaxID=28095 RepID=UPI001ABB1F34
CPQLVVDDWLAHLLVSVVPMPEVNSSPRKLTAPRALFETVSKDSQGHDIAVAKAIAAQWKGSTI